jgi:Domain of unknown function (DUF4440)/Domain of unknown function (DUF3471)
MSRIATLAVFTRSNFDATTGLFSNRVALKCASFPGGFTHSSRALLTTAILAASVLPFSCSRVRPITQDELVRRSQEMMDAVPAGNQAPWKQFVADDVLYFDEKGRAMDKAALLADLTPMPAGYSGSIEIVNVKSHIEPAYAVVSFDEDEKETIHGQNLTARYHETDTWAPRNGVWQIVAGQVLRYYEDPAAGVAYASRLPQYVGTYELAPGTDLTITLEDGKLFRQRGSSPKVELIPEAADIFFRKGVEGRILFRNGPSGKVDALIDRRNNEDIVWKKIR